MTDAEGFLESEPELKAFVEKISNQNHALNASTKLLQYLIDHVDRSVFQESECQVLLNAWIRAQGAILKAPK